MVKTCQCGRLGPVPGYLTRSDLRNHTTKCQAHVIVGQNSRRHGRYLARQAGSTEYRHCCWCQADQHSKYKSLLNETGAFANQETREKDFNLVVFGEPSCVQAVQPP